jgi:cytochrome o ubiquinol oxidase subunit 2
VLDPKGPIAAAERQILFNSLGIMLAIVIPTILATLGVAFWFRASNKRARYLPDFEYSGRLEMLVWSIPAMTVLLVGGVAWVGSHDLDPRKPIASTREAVRFRSSRSTGNGCSSIPTRHRERQSTDVPVGTPVSFELTSSGVMNSFFVPQLGSQIYTMAGMVTRLHLQADHPGTTAGCRPISAATALPTCASTSMRCRPRSLRSGWMQRAQRRSGARRASYADLAKPSKAVAPSPIAPSLPACSRIVSSEMQRADDDPCAAAHPTSRGRKMNLLGKLTGARSRSTSRSSWARRRSAWSWSSCSVLGWVTLKGYVPYLWREWITSDHKRIGVMYIMLALVMLLRGFSDAIMMRAQQAVAAGGAQGYLPPEHFDQIFSAHGTIMIFFMAMPFVIG